MGIPGSPSSSSTQLFGTPQSPGLLFLTQLMKRCEAATRSSDWTDVTSFTTNWTLWLDENMERLQVPDQNLDPRPGAGTQFNSSASWLAEIFELRD